MIRTLKWSLVSGAALAVATGGYIYYRYNEYYPSTNDAYLQANVVKVTPMVSGRVITLPVNDQQQVKQGQQLFQIDPRRFQYQVQQAEAQLSLARQQVAADQAAVAAARAAIEDRQARLENARRQYQRTQKLVAQKVKPQSELDNARATLDSAKAALKLARAQLQQAEQQLGSSGQQNERIRSAQAQLDTARLDLSYTRQTAPCDGRLASLELQKGDRVSAGAAQFSLVCDDRFWVYANFKETDLTRIRPGQVATIDIDMYPNHPFHGIVESVNPASGTAFSLLPPENATGNWVKVTQRVPVRILVVDDSPAYPLRVQTSTEVRIDTGSARTPLGKPRGAVLNDAEAMAQAKQQGLTSAGTGAGN